MTEEQIKSALSELTEEQVFAYCDALDLERPDTKEKAIDLLLANCKDCIADKLRRNATFVVKYINLPKPQAVISRKGVVKSNSECKTCGK